MSRARLTRRLATCLAVVMAGPVLGLAACAPSPSPGTPEGLPEGLSASIQQGRLDIEARRLVVRLENTGEATVTVQRLEVDSPSLAPGMVRDEPFEVAPGHALQVRMELTASECAVGDDSGHLAAVVLLDVSTDGDSGTVSGELPADDPFGTLARVTGEACLADSVEQVATLAMPEHLRSTGLGADRRAFIDVEVVPAASGTGSFTIDRVYGTTLLNAEDGVDWPLGVEVVAGDEPFTISLPVRPARCDAHAIADDKRGTILPFAVRTSDGREGRLDRSSGDTLKAELYAYYGERCALQ